MGADRVEESYRRLHARLWRSLFAFCGDRELASDAEAEAYAQALGRVDDLRDVDAWVWRSAFRIATGALADRTTGARSASPEQLDVLPTEDASVVEFVSQLQALSGQQRAVVVLRYVGGLTPAEIAEALGTSSGSVRVQLHRAHHRLRNDLEVLDGR
ncbi:MAG: sigma-70 family RNA polymerase sigma factor [Acidimicrobiales bacterium]|nr:sigma-70 family RNA polymerase sigma factor [Acidimicrobiales bacterium]